MIRQLDTTVADQASAQVFFSALFRAYDLDHAKVLDAFARNGQLTVRSYHDFLSDPRTQLEVWELQPEHETALKMLTPQVQIGDSYQLIRTVRHGMYDLLVVDTPQGLHRSTDGRVHAEHWDFVEDALPTVRAGGVVVLYVNKEPYDARLVGSHGYDQYPEYDYVEWMWTRQELYGFSRGTEEAFLHRYRQLFKRAGRVITSMLMTPCHSDVPGLAPYAFRLAVCL
jgi:hypothetical protein